MGAVFINYRRGDTEGQARALYNELSRILGEGAVFMDVDNIPLGKDFREAIQDRLSSCEMMLVLIGRDWLAGKSSSARPRIEQPDDFVRIEIAAALKRGIPVTPVLLEGAQLPSQEQLPADLKDLAFRNGFEVSHTRWESDVREMVRRLNLRKQTASDSTPQKHRSWAAWSASAVVGAAILAALAWWLWPRPLTFQPIGSPVQALAVSDDGRRLVAASGDLKLRLFDLATGEVEKAVDAGCEVVNLAFSHDGARVLSACHTQKRLQLWTAALDKIQAFEVDEVLAGYFSPEDRSVLACSVPGATLIDTTNGQRRSFLGGITWCTAGAFLDENRALLTGRGSDVVLWDFLKQQELQTFRGSGKWVTRLASSPRGKGHFVVGCSEYEPTCQLWDYETGERVRPLTGQSGNVLAVTFSADGRTVLSASQDGTIVAWDRDTGEVRFRQRAHTASIHALIATPDGNYILSGSDDGTIGVWDASSGVAIGGTQDFPLT